MASFALIPGVAVGPSLPLLLALVSFWVAAVGISLAYLPVRVALPLVTIKFLLVGTYFVFWGDGSWHIGNDDATYAREGFKLYLSGENPIAIWFSTAGRYLLIEAPHNSLIFWWNMLWMYLIYPAYYAPVIANVCVTVLSGFVFDKILSTIGFGRTYRLGFAIFFLVHWHVLAWSSFLNIKESLITLFLLVIVFSITKIEKRGWGYVVMLLGAGFLMLGVRFYLPAL